MLSEGHGVVTAAEDFLFFDERQSFLCGAIRGESSTSALEEQKNKS